MIQTSRHSGGTTDQPGRFEIQNNWFKGIRRCGQIVHAVMHRVTPAWRASVCRLTGQRPLHRQILLHIRQIGDKLFGDHRNRADVGNIELPWPFCLGMPSTFAPRKLIIENGEDRYLLYRLNNAGTIAFGQIARGAEYDRKTAPPDAPHKAEASDCRLQSSARSRFPSRRVRRIIA